MATTNSTTTGELRTIALSAINVREGFALVDGERRIRAAAELGLMEIPAVVRATDEQTGGLEEAVVANYHRAELSIVEEALAFGRLLELGLTRSGVAEELSVSRRLVTDRLELLKLPEALRPKLDDGSIRPGAVKALVSLAAIHPELPALAVAAVEEAPEDQWQEPLTWAGVAEDPIAAVMGQEPSRLPEGVYEDRVPYAVEAFALSEKALKDLAALRKIEPQLLGEGAMTAYFGPEEIEAAEALGAAHRSARGYSALIVGADVAAQLVGDSIAAMLKQARQVQRRRREAEQSMTGASGVGEDETPEPTEISEEEAQELRRQEREAEIERRRQAVAHNAELGAAVLNQARPSLPLRRGLRDAARVVRGGRRHVGRTRPRHRHRDAGRPPGGQRLCLRGRVGARDNRRSHS